MITHGRWCVEARYRWLVEEAAVAGTVEKQTTTQFITFAFLKENSKPCTISFFIIHITIRLATSTMAATQVGWIGLGSMGIGMSKNLQKYLSSINAPALI